MKDGERLVIYPTAEPARIDPCGCTVIDRDGREVLFPCVLYQAAELAGERTVAA